MPFGGGRYPSGLTEDPTPDWIKEAMEYYNSARGQAERSNPIPTGEEINLPRYKLPYDIGDDEKQAREYAQKRGLEMQPTDAEKAGKGKRFSAGVADSMHMLGQILHNKAERKRRGGRTSPIAPAGFLKSLREKQDSESKEREHRIMEIERLNQGVGLEESRLRVRSQEDAKRRQGSAANTMANIFSRFKPKEGPAKDTRIGTEKELELLRKQPWFKGLSPDEQQQREERLMGTLDKAKSGKMPPKELANELRQDPSFSQFTEREQAELIADVYGANLGGGRGGGQGSSDVDKLLARRFLELRTKGGGVDDSNNPIGMSVQDAQSAAEGDKTALQSLLEKTGKITEINPFFEGSQDPEQLTRMVNEMSQAPPGTEYNVKLPQGAIPSLNEAGKMDPLQSAPFKQMSGRVPVPRVPDRTLAGPVGLGGPPPAPPQVPQEAIAATFGEKRRSPEEIAQAISGYKKIMEAGTYNGEPVDTEELRRDFFQQYGFLPEDLEQDVP